MDGIVWVGDYFEKKVKAFRWCIALTLVSSSSYRVAAANMMLQCIEKGGGGIVGGIFSIIGLIAVVAGGVDMPFAQRRQPLPTRFNGMD